MFGRRLKKRLFFFISTVAFLNCFYFIYHITDAKNNTLSKNSVNKKGYVDLHKSSRLKEYCNPPIEKPTGDEGVLPEKFQIHMVIVLTRHGDRASIFHYGHQSPEPISCLIDENFIHKYPILGAFKDRVVSGHRKGKYQGKNFHGWDLYPANIYCKASQLTPIGVVQHIYNGQYLKERYQSHLFPYGFTHDALHVFSTAFTRTFQSAVSLLYGFIDNLNMSDLLIYKSLLASNYICNSEYSRNVSCGCIYRGISPPLLKDKLKVETNLLKISDIIQYDLSDHKLTRIVDNFMPRVCHKKKLDCNNQGKCIDDNILEMLWSMADEEFQTEEADDNYQTYGHLVGHPFLLEVAEWFKKATTKKTTKKFLLFSTHDRTVEVILTALGIGNGRWTPYASRVVMELYSERKHADDYYIRVLFNGKDRTNSLPFCQPSSGEMSCPLEKYLEYVDTHLHLIGVHEYTKECGKSNNLKHKEY